MKTQAAWILIFSTPCYITEYRVISAINAGDKICTTNNYQLTNLVNENSNYPRVRSRWHAVVYRQVSKSSQQALAQRRIVSGIYLWKHGRCFRFIPWTVKKFIQVFPIYSEDHDGVSLKPSRHSKKYIGQHALEIRFTHGVLLAVSELVKNLCARSQEHKLFRISFMDLWVQYCPNSLAVRACGSFQIDPTCPMIKKTTIAATHRHTESSGYSIYMRWCYLFGFSKESQNGKGCYWLMLGTQEWSISERPSWFCQFSWSAPETLKNTCSDIQTLMATYGVYWTILYSNALS